MAKQIEIVFSLGGWCKQGIELYDDRYTPDEIVRMLNNGQLVTSVQEGGELLLIDGFETIGEVVMTEPEGEYFDFELSSVYDGD